VDSDSHNRVALASRNRADWDSRNKAVPFSRNRVSDSHNRVDSHNHSKVDSHNHSKVDSDSHSKVDSHNHSKVDSHNHSKVDSHKHSKVEQGRKLDHRKVHREWHNKQTWVNLNKILMGNLSQPIHSKLRLVSLNKGKPDLDQCPVRSHTSSHPHHKVRLPAPTRRICPRRKTVRLSSVNQARSHPKIKAQHRALLRPNRCRSRHNSSAERQAANSGNQSPLPKTKPTNKRKLPEQQGFQDKDKVQN